MLQKNSIIFCTCNIENDRKDSKNITFKVREKNY